MATVSVVASIVSIILAGFAIWLSVTFYKMTTSLSESTKEAAKGIAAGVDRLEKLFDKLYADTFGMMKETVSDMRKHIWPETGADTTKLIEEKADEKIAQFSKGIKDELTGMLYKIGKTDKKVEAVHSKVESFVDKVINESRRAEKEAREEFIRSAIIGALRTLAEKSPHFTMRDLVNAGGDLFTPSEAIQEVLRLQNKGIVRVPENVRRIHDVRPDTPIVLLRPLK